MDVHEDMRPGEVLENGLHLPAGKNFPIDGGGEADEGLQVHEPIGLPGIVQERHRQRRREADPQGEPDGRRAKGSLSAD